MEIFPCGIVGQKFDEATRFVLHRRIGHWNHILIFGKQPLEPVYRCGTCGKTGRRRPAAAPTFREASLRRTERMPYNSAMSNRPTYSLQILLGTVASFAVAAAAFGSPPSIISGLLVLTLATCGPGLLAVVWRSGSGYRRSFVIGAIAPSVFCAYRLFKVFDVDARARLGCDGREARLKPAGKIGWAATIHQLKLVANHSSPAKAGSDRGSSGS
jgi:hypothetical protein